MQPHSKLWRRVLEAYRAADWHESIRQTRGLVDADPFALTPRQLLAGLYVKVGSPRLALVQYEKLLPIAVGNGDLFRALAIQKHIDHLSPGTDRSGSRFLAMQKWFRSLGRPRGPVSRAGQLLGPAQLLALPAQAFQRVASRVAVQELDLTSQVIEAPARTLWAVVFGRVQWSLELPDEKANSGALAEEGDSIYADPDLAAWMRVYLAPEMPSECLRFEPELIHDLTHHNPELWRSMAQRHDPITPEGRAMLPTRPLRSEDLDDAPMIPEAAPGAPPRLTAASSPPPSESQQGGEQKKEASRDTGDWVEFGMVALPAESPGTRKSSVRPEPPGDPGERLLDLPAPGRRKLGRKRGRPVSEPPGAVVLDGGLVIPPTRDPFADQSTEYGQPIERRAEARAVVSFQTRMVVLGLPELGLEALTGQLSDISPSGFGMRFTGSGHARVGPALADTVVAVELALSDAEGPLRLAARVRSVELEEDLSATRVGAEFVLLTFQDRSKISRAMERAAQA